MSSVNEFGDEGGFFMSELSTSFKNALNAASAASVARAARISPSVRYVRSASESWRGSPATMTFMASKSSRSVFASAPGYFVSKNSTRAAKGCMRSAS